jgi:hypothetical protein
MQVLLIQKEINMYVSIYTVDRCYGGPEEGGWWYDWWELQSSSGFIHSKRKAESLREQKREELRPFQPRYNRFSAAGGTDLVAVIEDKVGEHARDERPHYC